ncbi:hypothetical protein E2562_018203 [Oryza meyeriana var. granulata]|uniref:Uncharacterized protein n=1 Tax=Oryza meyeriana var. granulata TaxID=110450 RepID=A0A6G1C6J2_9ORYZ|nr:hypothetical protein E2562_018203 [Oryza meyeriana var. granulata]
MVAVPRWSPVRQAAQRALASSADGLSGGELLHSGSGLPRDELVHGGGWTGFLRDELLHGYGAFSPRWCGLPDDLPYGGYGLLQGEPPGPRDEHNDEWIDHGAKKRVGAHQTAKVRLRCCCRAATPIDRRRASPATWSSRWSAPTDDLLGVRATTSRLEEIKLHAMVTTRSMAARAKQMKRRSSAPAMMRKELALCHDNVVHIAGIVAATSSEPIDDLINLRATYI